MDLFDRAIHRSLDLILHLHGFHNGKRLVLPHFILQGNTDLYDLTRHGRLYQKSSLCGSFFSLMETLHLFSRFFDNELLTVDLGGNDEYYGGVAASTSGRPIGLLLDMGGDDRYESDSPAQGAGMAGVGILIDADGNDYYEGKRYAQGAGQFGLGLCVDLSGNDHYFNEESGQGCGYFGIGLLFDSTCDRGVGKHLPARRRDRPAVLGPRFGPKCPSQRRPLAIRADRLHDLRPPGPSRGEAHYPCQFSCGVLAPASVSREP